MDESAPSLRGRAGGEAVVFPLSLGAVTPNIFLSVLISRLILCSMQEYIMFRKLEVCFLMRCLDN